MTVVSSDIDKVMINLKTEEFVLDGPPLQSLQQLIQWVGDFVLYLLANLPNQVRSRRSWRSRRTRWRTVRTWMDPLDSGLLCPCRAPWCVRALAS